MCLGGPCTLFIKQEYFLTEIHSAAPHNTWNPQEMDRDICFTSLYGHFHGRNVR